MLPLVMVRIVTSFESSFGLAQINFRSGMKCESYGASLSPVLTGLFFSITVVEHAVFSERQFEDHL